MAFGKEDPGQLPLKRTKCWFLDEERNVESTDRLSFGPSNVKGIPKVVSSGKVHLKSFGDMRWEEEYSWDPQHTCACVHPDNWYVRRVPTNTQKSDRSMPPDSFLSEVKLTFFGWLVEFNIWQSQEQANSWSLYWWGQVARSLSHERHKAWVSTCWSVGGWDEGWLWGDLCVQHGDVQIFF